MLTYLCHSNSKPVHPKHVYQEARLNKNVYPEVGGLSMHGNPATVTCWQHMAE